jgi:hypothetical protein
MASASPPGSVPANNQTQVLLSSGIQTGVTVTFSIGPNLTWDAYCRMLYERVNEGIQRQANALVARGNVTAMEARQLVESQRNAVLSQMRTRLSPFGRYYSEVLKPSSNLPTLERLVMEKGSIEAVLKSVGKTRQVVNRFATVSRVVGPASIVLQVTMTAIVIKAAPPMEKGRVAAKEIGSAVGAASFGTGGMWAGCFALSSLASPAIVVPIVGEVTTGAACVVGGILGGVGFGWIGQNLGLQAGENVYNFATDVTWIRR